VISQLRMGSGADIAVEISDVIILNNSLESLRKAIELVKRSLERLNKTLALALNL